MSTQLHQLEEGLMKVNRPGVLLHMEYKENDDHAKEVMDWEGFADPVLAIATAYRIWKKCGVEVKTNLWEEPMWILWLHYVHEHLDQAGEAPEQSDFYVFQWLFELNPDNLFFLGVREDELQSMRRAVRKNKKHYGADIELLKEVGLA